ncbi:hypothetical protein JOF53_003447 [Crossiella equi]|uniref:Uncharacterized protein n=1 Tax=Crossiella equi TaxID=130796 RepID=A0ABS5ADB7_9PSEU|nr:hypothetical protein [Crossiella equi]
MRVSPDDSCPASTRGHTYKVVKGEWVCVHCGRRM